MSTSLNSRTFRGEARYIQIKETVEQRLGSPYNDCLEESESAGLAVTAELNSVNSKYRQNLCYALCSLQHQEKVCSCELPYQRGMEGMNDTCESSCIKGAMGKFKYDCECPMQCNTVRYELNDQKFILKDEKSYLENLEAIVRLGNLSLEYIANNTVFFHIFYEEVATEISEVPQMTITNLVAELGGTVGK